MFSIDANKPNVERKYQIKVLIQNFLYFPSPLRMKKNDNNCCRNNWKKDNFMERQ